MKILIVMPSWIGDAIMSQPLLTRLRAKYPDARIDALATPWVEPVVLRMPEIDSVISSPLKHKQLNWKGIKTAAKELSKTQYDQVFVLPNSFKSALIPWLAKIPVRKGFLGECRWGLINNVMRPDPKKTGLLVARYLMLADEKPHHPAANDAFFPPKLKSSLENQTAVLSAFNLNDGKKNILFCPGAEYGPAKQWPVEHFAMLAKSLAELGVRVVILGTQKDVGLGETIQTQAGLNEKECVNLCGKTSLDQAIDLIAASDGVVCNDSGLMHVASAVGAKLIAIYGSSAPSYTPPLSDNATVLQEKTECSPCFQRQCKYGHYNCLKNITPNRVLSLLLPEHSKTEAETN